MFGFQSSGERQKPGGNDESTYDGGTNTLDGMGTIEGTVEGTVEGTTDGTSYTEGTYSTYERGYERPPLESIYERNEDFDEETYETFETFGTFGSYFAEDGAFCGLIKEQICCAIFGADPPPPSSETRVTWNKGTSVYGDTSVGFTEAETEADTEADTEALTEALTEADRDAQPGSLARDLPDRDLQDAPYDEAKISARFEPREPSQGPGEMTIRDDGSLGTVSTLGNESLHAIWKRKMLSIKAIQPGNPSSANAGPTTDPTAHPTVDPTAEPTADLGTEADLLGNINAADEADALEASQDKSHVSRESHESPRGVDTFPQDAPVLGGAASAFLPFDFDRERSIATQAISNRTMTTLGTLPSIADAPCEESLNGVSAAGLSDAHHSLETVSLTSDAQESITTVVDDKDVLSATNTKIEVEVQQPPKQASPVPPMPLSAFSSSLATARHRIPKYKSLHPPKFKRPSVLKKPKIGKNKSMPDPSDNAAQVSPAEAVPQPTKQDVNADATPQAAPERSDPVPQTANTSTKAPSNDMPPSDHMPPSNDVAPSNDMAPAGDADHNHSSTHDASPELTKAVAEDTELSNEKNANDASAHSPNASIGSSKANTDNTTTTIGSSQHSTAETATMTNKTPPRKKPSTPPREQSKRSLTKSSETSSSQGTNPKARPRRKPWREIVDVNTGEIYYYNGIITTWERPPDYCINNIQAVRQRQRAAMNNNNNNSNKNNKVQQQSPPRTPRRELIREKLEGSKLHLIRKLTP